MSYNPDDLDTPAATADIAAEGKKRIEREGEERRRSREASLEEVGAQAGRIARAEAVIRAADEMASSVHFDCYVCKDLFEAYSEMRQKYRLAVGR